MPGQIRVKFQITVTHYSMKDYRTLLVWKRAHEFTLMIYDQTKHFPDNEKYGITSQLKRASASVPTNIAERCGRYSQREFKRFLQIACGSIYEVSYLNLLATDLKYSEQELSTQLGKRIAEVQAMLISLISKIRKDTN
jgi:four helix bundle protein